MSLESDSSVASAGNVIPAHMTPTLLGKPLAEWRALAEKATPGPWDVYAQRVDDRTDAKTELAMQVDDTDPFVGVLYLLNANGKCPATTGCGPTSKDNAAFLAGFNPVTVLAALSLIEQLSATVDRMALENDRDAARFQQQAVEIERLKAALKLAPDELTDLMKQMLREAKTGRRRDRWPARSVLSSKENADAR